MYLHCRAPESAFFQLIDASHFYPLVFFLAKRKCLGSFHLLLPCIHFQSKSTPENKNDNGKNNHLKMYQPLNMVIFCCHLSFPEGTSKRCKKDMFFSCFVIEVGPLSLVGASLICAGSASLAIFELRSMVFFCFGGGAQKLGTVDLFALEDVRRRDSG